jgi:hypothetical protein
MADAVENYDYDYDNEFEESLPLDFYNIESTSESIYESIIRKMPE